MESGIHVVDVPQYYNQLKTFICSCTEANMDTFMTGENVPFNRDLIKKDNVWDALVTPSYHDSVAATMLLSIFQSFELLLDRVLSDHSNVILAIEENEQNTRSETTTVQTTNTISERDFAKFDRLLREKPNASTLALEAHILFTNNKTSKWFSTKPAVERETMMEEARKNAPQYRKMYRQRIALLTEEKVKQQCQKEKEKKESERKMLVAKEKITSEIINFGGLWQTEKQVDSVLSSIKSKRVAIKAQLRFCKTVLQQEASNETLYKFSSKDKGQYTAQVLQANLMKLIRAAGEREISTSSLTGKTIMHRFQESDGTFKSYEGRIISQVPGFHESFNLV